jgi:hypothetical protein
MFELGVLAIIARIYGRCEAGLSRLFLRWRR